MKHKLRKFLRDTVKTVFFAVYFFATLSPLNAQAANLNLSDLPLTVSTNVPPNIIVTVDDSGDMRRAHLPDESGSGGNRTEVYYRSSHFNKIYYNPGVDYLPPKDADGATLDDADFNTAVRGFYYDSEHQDVVDLASNFRPFRVHNWNEKADYIADCEECEDNEAHYFQYSENPLTNSDCLDESEEDRPTSAVCYNEVVIEDGTNYGGIDGTNIHGRTIDEERTNFANWYQYYAVRGDAAKTVLMRAFVPESVGESVRVGRQTLNRDDEVQSGDPDNDVDGLAIFDATERAHFYQWLKEVRTTSDKPLRRALARAGEYYTNAEAYRLDPQNDASDIVSCRANAHILVSDGDYDDDIETSGSDSILSSTLLPDEQSTTLPDGESYNPNSGEHHIFDNNLVSDSLADLAFHYWATDLYSPSTLPNNNNVLPYYVIKTGPDGEPADEDYWNPANDPAEWQHMINYMVSFGTAGSVPTTSEVYDALLAGDDYTNTDGDTQNGWPATVDIHEEDNEEDNSAGRVDDMYHAAINSRGGFFDVSDSDKLAKALRSITNRLESRQATALSVVASSGQVSSDSLVFAATYDVEKWIGQLGAFEISDGSEFDPNVSPTTCNSRPFGEICDEVWDAASVNTEDAIDHTTRKVFTYRNTASAGANPAGSGINFTWTSLDANQKALLDDGDGLGQQRVDYLRGDSSNETDNGGIFRSRLGLKNASEDTRVGPIIHSPPVYVGNGVDANGVRQFNFPDNLESASYSSFLSSIAGRKPMVYVGTNDGMLHGYNARSSGGQEVFSYVPNAVMGSLHELTEPVFQSGAYVDGRIAVQDVFYSGAWRTLLVGGLRSGGKGYYALDVTNPVEPANSIVNWEFTDENDADMGFSYGRAQLVRANNGKWVVIVANGYNSSSEHAALFILDARNGRVIKKITVDDTGNNGLSGPIAVNADGDLNAEYVYAGDLKGNMWKFDLASPSTANWTYSKLSSAGDKQPITATPTAGNHPGNGNGRVVYFGTGKYIETSDTVSSDTQAFYGILDDDSCTSKSSPCVDNNALVTQTVSNAGNAQRETSDNPIDWGSDKGWKLVFGNISGVSERVVGQASLSGSVLVFVSLVPAQNSCSPGGESFLYALDRSNGGKTENQVIDTNGDGIVDFLDTNNGDVFNAIRLGGISTPMIEGSMLGGPDGKASFNVGGESHLLDNLGTSGRIRWRQLK